MDCKIFSFGVSLIILDTLPLANSIKKGLHNVMLLDKPLYSPLNISASIAFPIFSSIAKAMRICISIEDTSFARALLYSSSDIILTILLGDSSSDCRDGESLTTSL